SASVEDDTSVIQLSTVFAKGDGVEIDLPVSLAAQGDLDQVTAVVIFVDPTEGSFRFISLFVAVTQVETEHWLIQQILIQHVVERRYNPIDGDGVISKPKNAIESAEGESKTWFAGCLSEVLPYHL